MMNKSAETVSPYYTETSSSDTAGIVYEARTVNRGWHDVSLSAILCGVVIALIVMLAMNMLGLSIGANSINPMTEANPVEPALGTASILWISASTLFALFAGGWVAGRLSSTKNHLNSVLHGVVTWAITSMLLLLVMSSTIGSLISGVGQAVNQGAALLGGGVVNTVPAVVDSLGIEGETLEAITGEFQRMINTPETTTTTNADGETVEQQVSAAVSSLSLADLRLSRDVMGAVTGADVNASQQETVAAMMAERLSISEDEAMTMLTDWREAYQDVRIQAEETAREVGQTVSDTLAAVAGVLFAVLFTGAAAAGIGGYLAVSWHDDVTVAPAHQVRH